MGQHETHRMHDNSMASWRRFDMSKREREVCEAYDKFGCLTDREVCKVLGSQDMNHARPAITKLLEDRMISEVGKTKCSTTGRMVRRVGIVSCEEPMPEPIQCPVIVGKDRRNQMNHSETPNSCEHSDIGNIKVFHQPRNRIAHNMAHRNASQQAFTPECIGDAIGEIDRLQAIEYEHQAMVAQQSVLVKPNHSPDTGKKVDHCVEVNEMVDAIEHIRDSLTDWDNPIGGKDDLDTTIWWIRNTEARRVEAVRLLKATTTISMNYAKPGDPAYAGHPHECCEEWISDAIKCLNENGESI